MPIKNVTVNDLGDVLSTPFMMPGSKDLIKTGWKGDIAIFSTKLWKYSWPRTRDYTMAVIMLTVVVAASKAKDIKISAKKRDENYKKLEEDENDISLSEYINKKVKKSKISDLFNKIINIENSGDSSNIADSISKENKPHGWFAKCFINLLLASKNKEEDAKTVFGNFLKQVKKMTKWKINKSYMKELTDVISSALAINMQDWKDRYDDNEDEKEKKELTYDDYREYYASQASDGRNLHGSHFEEDNSNTRKLDNKFITSVMERRYGHLQQVKYCIKYFMDKTGDVAFVNKVLDYNISCMEKSLKEDERENEFEKYCKRMKLDPLKEESRRFFDTFNSIDSINEKILELKNIKQTGGFNKDMTTLVETYSLIDELLKHLMRYPEKIPNLKLSGTSVERINKVLKEIGNSGRGEKYILEIGKSYKQFMITSDEPTDRILAEFENFAYDGDNFYHDIESLCTKITSIPKKFAYMEEFHIAKLPASKSLPNPYRGKYGVE